MAIIDILGKSGGIGFRYILPAFFFAATSAASFTEWSRTRSSKDRLVFLSSVFGLLSQIFLLTLCLISSAGQIVYQHFDAKPFFTELVLEFVSGFFTAYAALVIYLRNDRGAKKFGLAGLIVSAFLMVAITLIIFFFTPNKAYFVFEHFREEAAFGIAECVLYLLAIVIFVNSEKNSDASHSPVFTFLTLLFLSGAAGGTKYLFGESLDFISLSGMCLYFKNFAAYFFMVSYWGLTQRRLAESESFRKNIFETSRSALCIADFSGTLKSASVSSAALFGVAPSELSGRNLSDFGYDRGAVAANMTSVIRGESASINFESGFRDGSGVEKFLSWNVKPIFDEKLLFMAVSDLTEKKAASAAMAEIEAKYRSLFENMLNAFAYFKVICDPQGKPIDCVFIEVNDAFEKLTGISKRAVAGKSVGEALPLAGDENLDWIMTCASVARTGAGLRFEQYNAKLEKWYGIFAYSPARDYFVTIFSDITEKKLAENALKNSEVRYRSIFETTATAMAIIDSSFVIVMSNGKFISLSGREKDDVDGKMNLFDFVAPETAASLKEYLSGVMNPPTKNRPDLEFVFRDRAGRSRTVLATSGLIPDTGLAVISLLEISALKQTEKSLRESESKFRTLTETSACSIFIYQDDNFVYVNPATVSMTGFSEKELLSMKYWERIHPNSREFIKNLGKSRLAGEKLPNRYEVIFLDKNNESLWLDVTTGIIDFNGKPAVIVSAFDVTDRKIVEKELKKKEEYFRALIENASDMLLIIDQKGLITFRSPSFEKIFEYHPAADFDKNISEFIHPEDLSLVSAAMFGNAEGGKAPAIHTEFRMRRADGTYMTAGAMCRNLISDPAINGIVLTLRDVTDRKKSETALVESEKRHRNMLESVKLIAIMLDGSGKITFCNDYFLSITGHRREDVINRVCFELLLPSSQQAEALAEYRDTISTGAFKARLVSEIITSGGGHLSISWTRTLIRDPQGTIIGMTWLGEDVTEKKRSNERLNKLNAIFLNLGPDYLRNIELLTKSCGELLGAYCSLYYRLKNGELGAVGEWNTPPDFNAPVKSEGHICFDTIKKSKESGIYIVRNLPETEYFTTDPNVSKYGLKTYIGHPIYCYGQKTGALCAVFTKDIEFDDTDRTVIDMIATAIVIEEERKASEEQIKKLSQAVEQSPSVVVITDTEGNIEYVNPKFTELTGYEAGEVIGKNPSILKSGDKTKEDYSAIWNTIISGKVWRGEFHNKRKNGDLYWESASISPIIQKGVITNFIAVKEDITERKKAQEELLKISKLDSLSLLAGGIAHDFNNILTGIIGNISLAKILSGPGNKIYEALSKAEDVSFQAKDLTRQLLTFSKGYYSRKKIVDLGEIIKESANFIVRGTGCKCSFEIDDDLWPAEADAGQFGQVITNLTINSIQAMPEGGIIKIKAGNSTIERSGAMQVKPGKYVRISIEDTGTGIDPENIQKIFDPYFTTKARGSGLGLATVYSIVKSHDGHVSVESRPGAGTLFQLFFPAACDKKNSPDALAEQNVQLVGKGRILFMDDEEQIRNVTVSLLNHLGFEASSAPDGSQALEMYKAAKEKGEGFDLVIMDLTIPGGMGGVETIKKLREYDPDALAIAASGYFDDPSITANYQKHGFLEFISKPFKIQELSQSILKHINGRKLRS